MMGFQTKIITCFLSILGCVSVMTTGVVAILYQNDLLLINSETIEMQATSGKLYVMRFGAGYYDIYDKENSTTKKQQPLLLFDNSELVDQSLYNDFLSNVTFAPQTEQSSERKIEYLFKYELNMLSEEIIYIALVNEKLNQINAITREDLGTPSKMYQASYRFAFTEDEPDSWSDNTSTVLSEYDLSNKDNFITLDPEENPVVWIRCSLTPKQNYGIETSSNTNTSGDGATWRDETSDSREFNSSVWSFTLYFGNELQTLDQKLTSEQSPSN